MKVRYMDMMETFENARASVGGAKDINDAAPMKGLKAVVELCGATGDWEASKEK